MNQQSKLKRKRSWLRKISIIILTILILFFSLLFVVLTVISLPAFQNYVKEKVIASLEKKVGAPIKVGHIQIGLNGNIDIENVLLIDDKKDTLLKAGKINVHVNTSRLLQKEIDVLGILLSGVDFTYTVRNSNGETNLDYLIHAFSDTTKKQEEKPSSWKVGVHSVKLNNIAFNYHQVADSVLMIHHLDSFDIKFKRADIIHKRFITDHVKIDHYSGKLISYKRFAAVLKVDKEPKDTSKASSKLVIAIPDVEMHNISFLHYDSATRAGGFYVAERLNVMPKRIDLDGQQIVIDNFKMEHGKIWVQGAKQKETTKEKPEVANKKTEKGWNVDLTSSSIGLDSVFLTNLIAAPKGFEYLGNIQLVDVNTSLQARYLSSANWEAQTINLAFTDRFTKQHTSLKAKVKSAHGYIFLDSLDFKTGNSTLNGSVKLNTNAKDTLVIPDIYLDAFVQLRDIISYIPRSYIPKGISNPEKVMVEANIVSKNQQVQAMVNLSSDIGKIALEGNFLKGTQLADSKYKMQVKLDRFNLSAFTKDTSLGPLTADVNVTGVGIKPNNIVAYFRINLDTLLLKSRLYRNIVLQGSLHNENIDLSINSLNPIADFDAYVKGNLNKINQNINLITDIRNVDLHAMGFMKDTLALSAYMNVIYQGSENGTFHIFSDTNRIVLRTHQNELKSEQQWAFFSTVDSVSLEFYSANINFQYHGNIRLEEIPKTMKDYFYQYYSSREAKARLDKQKKFDFSLTMKQMDQYSEILPMDIKIPDENTIEMSLKDNQFTANFDVKKILIKDISLDTIDVSIKSDSTSLNLDMAVVVNSPTFKRRPIKFESNLADAQLDSRVKILAPDGQNWFNIGLSAYLGFPLLKVKVVEPLVLNHLPWQVDTGNLFLVDNNKVQTLDIRVQNDDKLIQLGLNPQNKNRYEVILKNLDLEFVSELLSGDTSSLRGAFNSNISFEPSKIPGTLPSFAVMVEIKQLEMKKYPLGDLHLNASNEKMPGIVDVDFKQELGMAHMFVNGNIDMGKEKQVNMTLQSRDFDIASLGSLLSAQLTDPKGKISSQLAVNGDISHPNVEGNIQFDSLSMGIVANNTFININNQSVYFHNNQVQMNNFTILDGDDNPLMINAMVNYADMKNINYQSKITTDKFLVYSTPPDQLATRESRVVVTSTIQVNGKGASPMVKADIKVDEGSKFFYQLSNKYNTYTEDGIVVFTDTASIVPEAKASVAQNMNLTANLTISPGTGIYIITDPARGDGFNLQAGGALTFAQQPFQAPRITGRVDISKGVYSMNLTGFKRNFEISPGSSISWNGDITNIDFKLYAYYSVKASPMPILPSSTSSQYAGLLPFKVNLNLEGSLATPEMAFEITLPREYEDVYNGMVASRLQQINADEALVNKQAMSLLLFGTFFDLTDISNSFLSGQGSTNVLISNALNQFAAQEIKFVDLHFDLQTFDFYGGGENYQDARTELKVEAAKKFMDNRLTTQAGGDFLLQGDPREETNMGISRVTPSFKVDYIINKKRTVTLKLFQQNEYRGLLEGKVISIGAGVQYSNDYNHARELFKRKEKSNDYLQ